MGRRQFAKNTAGVRHFRLVARSQNDTNPEATPLVLEPFVRPGEQRRTGLTEAELLEIPEALQTLGPDVFGMGVREDDSDDEAASPSNARGAAEAGEDPEDSQAFLDEDCYFPRDGYNYEQHLKRVSGAGEKGAGVVGVVIEATQKVEKREIAIQQARSREEEEALRALDEAEEYEEFEEGGLEELVASGFREDADMVLWGLTGAEERDLPDLEAFKLAHQQALGLRAAAGVGVDTEEAIDESDFAQFLEDEYGDEEIGACEEDEIEGDLEDAEEAVEEYIQERELEDKTLRSLNEPVKGKYDNVPRATDETRAIIERHYNEIPDVEDEEATCSGDETQDDSRNWDCESVLSTLSNLSNRPGKIGKIKIIGKPKPKAASDLAQVAEEDCEEGASDGDEDAESVLELPDVILERKKGETAEERRARKASVKELRRVCRQMKKETKQVYKDEAARLPGSTATADVKQKTRYQRL